MRAALRRHECPFPAVAPVGGGEAEAEAERASLALQAAVSSAKHA